MKLYPTQITGCEGDYSTFKIEDLKERGVLIEATFLAEMFDVEVENKEGQPLVFTLREKAP